ncbi:Hypothetical_protein [Hexamita inflata]|uniref:Hypothetical_protein n=1 Tax=Hexamita inflata TaxID=28002 RepID=A0AA86PMU5_9EUKA|nr:Hypothetical protein HINF_LOCUS25975 [Hexamita inflata]
MKNNQLPYIRSKQFVDSAMEILNCNQYFSYQIIDSYNVHLHILALENQRYAQFWLDLSQYTNVDLLHLQQYFAHYCLCNTTCKIEIKASCEDAQTRQREAELPPKPIKQRRKSQTAEYRSQFLDGLQTIVLQMFQQDISSTQSLLEFVSNIEDKSVRDQIWSRMVKLVGRRKGQLENYFAFLKVLSM